VTGIVAVAAQQHVVAAAADNGVVASPAIQHKASRWVCHTRRVDGVVAVAGTDNQPIAGIGTDDADRRRQPCGR